MTLRDALVKSKNVITVDLAMELNIGKVMNFATKAGFPKVAKAYPSMALGTAEATPLEVATAYTIFANTGKSATPIAVNRVTGGDGKTVTAPVTRKNRSAAPGRGVHHDRHHEGRGQPRHRRRPAVPGVFRTCRAKQGSRARRGLRATAGLRALRRTWSAWFMSGLTTVRRPGNEGRGFGDADLGGFYESGARSAS